jgi:hypothetical protein
VQPRKGPFLEKELVITLFEEEKYNRITRHSAEWNDRWYKGHKEEKQLCV